MIAFSFFLNILRGGENRKLLKLTISPGQKLQVRGCLSEWSGRIPIQVGLDTGSFFSNGGDTKKR